MNRAVLGSVLSCTFVLACGVAGFFVAACTPTTARVASTVELDLCRARAAYRVLAAAAGGALDPAPGSIRARLEQDEDAFCAARAALEPDPAESASPSPPAGSEPLPSSTSPKL